LVDILSVFDYLKNYAETEKTKNSLAAKKKEK